jgi:hypothetical protein
MKLIVNKCPHTGLLFECDKKYKNHIRILSNARRKEEKRKNEGDKFNAWLTTEKARLAHMGDILPWLLTNQKTLFAALNSKHLTTSHWAGKFFDDDKYTNLEFTQVRYSKLVSNTHSCPEGGVRRNWYISEDPPPEPMGYPGFEFRIEGSLSRSPRYTGEYPTTSLLEGLRIHTGTGGGRNEWWGFHGSIFIADWPGLQCQVNEMEMDQMSNVLKGKR